MQASDLHWPMWMEIQLQGTEKTYQKGTGTSWVGPVCVFVWSCVLLMQGCLDTCCFSDCEDSGPLIHLGNNDM